MSSTVAFKSVLLHVVSQPDRPGKAVGPARFGADLMDIEEEATVSPSKLCCGHIRGPAGNLKFPIRNYLYNCLT
jgi:hypothetical protein